MTQRFCALLRIVRTRARWLKNEAKLSHNCNYRCEHFYPEIVQEKSKGSSRLEGPRRAVAFFFVARLFRVVRRGNSDDNDSQRGSPLIASREISRRSRYIAAAENHLANHSFPRQRKPFPLRSAFSFKRVGSRVTRSRRTVRTPVKVKVKEQRAAFRKSEIRIALELT